MKRLLCLVFVLLLIGSVALAEVDLTGMSVEELSTLRDNVNQAILAQETENDSPSIFELDNDNFAMTVTGIEVADRETVNSYYDLYHPATANTDDNPKLVLLFTIENRSDATMDGYIKIDNPSVNGWMVSAYSGLRDVASGKKAKGFMYAELVDCEAETIEDIDSYEFTLIIRDSERNVLAEGKILLTHSGDNWIAS